MVFAIIAIGWRQVVAKQQVVGRRILERSRLLSILADRCNLNLVKR